MHLHNNFHRLSDPKQRISYAADVSIEIPVTQLRPGRWLLVGDFMLGQRVANPADDLRRMFIESVRYAIPHEVELNGIRLSKVPQLLAAMGLGGMT